ncbi:putative developmental regulator, ULTRAPETALA [Helianthus annuus]|uniref:Developmental regulator, ULTRAPETALA n=1 Tax=Helianthus annuus TaxID=4232 RepID=A0A251USH6_HELAN|nr:putative developmental regulator, ULTRAPETALA [Helianthus annuus]KAJ0585355.1 putative developmental regulator, ULTRAPETALA [Helianthus annuus]KAJ0919876.1 putative developmental regulator, ULTRAPETALA [Helianthus annuus]
MPIVFQIVTQLRLDAQTTGAGTIFSNEELSAFAEHIIVRAPRYIEIECGCTNNRLGDSVGIMRIVDDGTISTTCLCNPNCNRGMIKLLYTPIFFFYTLYYKNLIMVWVQKCNGEKIKLGETCLLRHYKGDEYVRPHNQVSHRDEFLRCSACNKIRRFELRSKDACRFYHDAASRETRTCHDMIPGRWTCEDLEERSSRRHSGCPKKTNCKGCTHCVCFGCQMCRFEDCGCQECIDFYANVPN